MANIVYRPRSATEILDASFHILRENYAAFVTLAALAYLPLAVFTVLLRRYTGLTTQAAAAAMGWNVILVLPVQLLWFSVMTSVVATLASRAYIQDPLDPGSTWKVIVPRLPVIIVSTIIVAAGSFIGFIFLFFPGFYFWTRYGMAPLIAALEGTSINGSFARATHLSHGNKLHIFGTMLLAIILYFIVAVGLGILFTMLPGILLQTVLGFLSTILIWPLLPMIQTALYYDLRIRAEGYDVDLMSRTLGPIGGTPAEAIV